MPAGDKVQIGKQFKVEFGGAVWTGYQFTSLTRSKTANVEGITDTRGANCTHILTNPGDQIAIAAMIEDAAGSITPPAVGEIIVVTPPGATRGVAYILPASTPVTHGNGVSTISATLLREDSMAAYYDAHISASITSPTANFSVGTPANVVKAVVLGDYATDIISVSNGVTALDEGDDWSFAAGNVTIESAYLAGLALDPDDIVTLTVRFDVGNDATITITATA